MRRVLEITAVLMLFVGFELAAGTFTHTLSRFEDTLRLSVAGESFVAPPASFVVGSIFAAFGVVLVGLIVWAKRGAKGLQTGTVCPHCGSETDRVKRGLRHRIMAALLGHRITRRRCKKCNWVGLSSIQ